MMVLMVIYHSRKSPQTNPSQIGVITWNTFLVFLTSKSYDWKHSLEVLHVMIGTGGRSLYDAKSQTSLAIVREIPQKWPATFGIKFDFPKKWIIRGSFFLTPVTTPLHSYQQLFARIPWQLGPECLQRARCRSTVRSSRSGVDGLGRFTTLEDHPIPIHSLKDVAQSLHIGLEGPFTHLPFGSFWYLHGVGIFTCIYHIYIFSGFYRNVHFFAQFASEIFLPPKFQKSEVKLVSGHPGGLVRLQKVSIKICTGKMHLERAFQG